MTESGDVRNVIYIHQTNTVVNVSPRPTSMDINLYPKYIVTIQLVLNSHR